jgi:uncharacterized surface protein with fasciclin (FAS1) repeats
MRRVLSSVLVIVTLLSIVSTGCKKKAFDEFYGRPDTLAQPIYQVLQQKGNFTSLLACIDKAGYKNILAASGYWTMFAPNDAAFQKFFAEQGISGIDKLDSATAQGIVTYALAYNAFTKARLNDYQANTGWIPNNSFRRRTANYISFYDDTTKTGTVVKALGSNRNNSFVNSDNNNKYVSYFTDVYFTAKGLPTSDYTYFYPNSSFSGFNVMDAAVLKSDYVAENGYIHETDKVILPAKNIDQHLKTTAQYTEFKKLLDKYIVSFVSNADATNRYKLLTGKNDPVYIKQFAPTTGFSPNNENFLKTQDNDGQSNAFTMIAPNNTATLNYIQNVLLERYSSLDALPTQIIQDFVNAHMWQTAMWPSKFAVTNNTQGEPPTINSTSDIVEKKVLSNGFFYGSNKVQEPNVFRTIYGRAYLDPANLLMTRALDQSYRFTITIPTLKYVMIMMSDAVLKKRGYDFSTVLNAWTYTRPGTSTVTSGSVPSSDLQRILGTHIVPITAGELDNITGSGIIETASGDYIKWNNGTFSSAGSQDSAYTVNTSSTKTSFNGRVYYADNLLTFSVKSFGLNLVALGGTSAATSQFFNFVSYLKNASIFTPASGAILTVQPGVFYTSFVPNNAAIVQAVKDGLLPGNRTTGVPNFAPTLQNERDLVNAFIYNHILNKITVVPDGKKQGTFETLYKNASGDAGQVNITSALNTMQIKDNFNRTSNVVIANSNNLADRCVIHLIDGYIKYNPN